ncbi:MAG TPA: HipA domain-containing protein [Pyrinomonadaceae bacterium]
MNRRKPTYLKNPQIEPKAIKYYADYQLAWNTLIPRLREYSIQTVDFLSIAGDAPKDFITDSEYRPGHRTRLQRSESYIAKVGSKFYPNESITEQLITEIGRIYGVKIADSKLRVVGPQVRFMSKYFLNRKIEQLTHGAEIYEYSLGKENYAQLAQNRTESDFFTFEMTKEALRQLFPEHAEKITKGYVEMLTFDALIGHNDRHPYNWGVIVPIQKVRAPRFSPVYDTARALFWNIPEARVRQMLTDEQQLEKYVRNCLAPIGCDKEPNVDFFRLIGLIWENFESYRNNIEKFLLHTPLKLACEMVDKQFGMLFSKERSELIKRCLRLRQKKLLEAIPLYQGEEELSHAD